MKELSIEQKAKAYDEALERAKKWRNAPNIDKMPTYGNRIIEEIFPELVESEDEKSKKWILEYLHDGLRKSDEQFKDHFKAAIAWLEKQGEQNPTNEPKFKVGDWVVFNNKHQSIYQVEKIEDGYYILRHTHGGTFRVCVLHDESLRLWTIQDAKDGDVLVSESNCGLNTWYCIFKSLDGDESMTVYCYLARDGRLETKKELCFDKDPYNTKPATKEQRDQLEKAITEAGYEWDAEKKELKKVEHTAWSEEDEHGFENCLYAIKETFKEVDNPHRVGTVDWLKSLKDRVQPQPKQEWSEEDRKIIIELIGTFESAVDGGNITFPYRLLKDYIRVLKSCMPQTNWRPSKEQIMALRWILNNIPYCKYKEEISGLLDQIKDL